MKLNKINYDKIELNNLDETINNNQQLRFQIMLGVTSLVSLMPVTMFITMTVLGAIPIIAGLFSSLFFASIVTLGGLESESIHRELLKKDYNKFNLATFKAAKDFANLRDFAIKMAKEEGIDYETFKNDYFNCIKSVYSNDEKLNHKDLMNKCEKYTVAYICDKKQKLIEEQNKAQNKKEKSEKLANKKSQKRAKISEIIEKSGKAKTKEEDITL